MATKKICGIYEIRSKIHLDRCYIGSAKNIKSRWSTHKRDLEKGRHNPIFQAHYNKYGWGDLVFKVIEQFDFISKEHIISREQFYIDNDCFKAYFCVNKIADSCEGTKRVFTEEHKQNMSKGRQGIVFTEEHCANISKGRKGIRGVIKKVDPDFHVNSGSWEKGHAPWNKGKKTGQKVWNKGKKTGVVPSSVFKKGMTPWNKGLKGYTFKKKSKEK